MIALSLSNIFFASHLFLGALHIAHPDMQKNVVTRAFEEDNDFEESFQAPIIDLQLLTKQGWILREEVVTEEYFLQDWVSPDGIKSISLESYVQDKNNPQTAQQMYSYFLDSPLEIVEISDDHILLLENHSFCVVKMIFTPEAFHILQYSELPPRESLQRGVVLLSEIQ